MDENIINSPHPEEQRMIRDLAEEAIPLDQYGTGNDKLKWREVSAIAEKHKYHIDAILERALLAKQVVLMQEILVEISKTHVDSELVARINAVINCPNTKIVEQMMDDQRKARALDHLAGSFSEWSGYKWGNGGGYSFTPDVSQDADDYPTNRKSAATLVEAIEMTM